MREKLKGVMSRESHVQRGSGGYSDISSTIRENRVCVLEKTQAYFRIKIETEFSDACVVELIDVPHDIRNGLDMKLYIMACGRSSKPQ